MQSKSISTTVVNISTLKPLDESLIIREAKKHMAVVTAEDHNIIGGLGDAICQVLTNNQIALPFKSIAVGDKFAETGSGTELYEKYGLSSTHVAEAIKNVFSNKII